MNDKVETVDEIMARWNPPNADHLSEYVVGFRPPEGDTRATAAANPKSGLHPASSDKFDAQRGVGAFQDDGEDEGLPEVPLDDDGDPDYDSMKNDDLKAHLAARDLPVSGKHAELVQRLEEDDADDDDDEDEDDES